MMYFKACPRCHGDLYQTQDSFGAYVECLQCGYLKDTGYQESVEAAIAQERDAA